MTIKIEATDPAVLQNRFERAMNICCIVASGGNLPSPADIAAPVTSGKYWARSGNRVSCLPISNDVFVNIVGETENEILFTIEHRYDTPERRFAERLGEMLTACMGLERRKNTWRF